MAAIAIGPTAVAVGQQPLPAPAGARAQQGASRPLDLKQPAFDWSAPAPPVDGPGTDTLGEFTALALSLHPTIRGAVAAVDSARGEAIQARLYPNPSLASGSPQANGAYSQWNVFVTQDVVTAGKLRLQQQAALRQVDARGFDLVRARFDVLTGTRRSFYALLVAQRRREILRRLFDVTERSVTVAERLLAGGEGTRSDVLFFKIARDQAAIRLRNADVFVEAGQRELAAAVGRPELDVGTVQGDLTADLPDFDLPLLQREVVAMNAKPRAAQAAVSRARWLLERARVQPIPDVNVLGGYQAQVDFPPQPQGLMQLMVEVPLFDRNQGNVRAARANIATALAERRQIELELAALTAEALAGYRTGGQLAEKYESAILPEARENLSLSQRLYAAGVVSFLNLVEAQRMLIDAELGYVEALDQRWRHAVAIADLLQVDAFPFATAAMAPVPAAPGAEPPAAPGPAAAPPPAPVPLPPVAPEPAAG